MIIWSSYYNENVCPIFTFFKIILDKSNKKCSETLEIYTFQEVTHMKFSEEVKTTLWSMIEQMSTNLSQFIVNPEKDFSRKKKWDFPTLMKFIISMEGQSLKMNFINTLDTRLNVHLTLRLIREEHKLKQMHLNTYLIVLHQLQSDS